MAQPTTQHTTRVTKSRFLICAGDFLRECFLCSLSCCSGTGPFDVTGGRLPLFSEGNGGGRNVSFAEWPECSFSEAPGRGGGMNGELL